MVPLYIIAILCVGRGFVKRLILTCPMCFRARCKTTFCWCCSKPHRLDHESRSNYDATEIRYDQQSEPTIDDSQVKIKTVNIFSA